MIPASSVNHYQEWAIHYAGEAFQLHCDASVHVEDFDDAVFWEGVFNHYTSSKKKFNFIYHSLTPSGSEATGVSHCLKFRPYLNRQFFICIDSDYCYLMQEPDIDPDHFIFQTYTYSIENHYCFSIGLNEVCEKATNLRNTIFDFNTFLKLYSNTLYEALIWHLYCLRNDETQFSKSQFTQIISLLQSSPNYDVMNNGKAVIDELERRCRTKVEALAILYPEVDIEAEKHYYKTLGLHQDNAYLYVRGHNLYDLICAIGNAVDEQLLNQEKQRLNGDIIRIKKLYTQKQAFETPLLRHIMFEYYPEIQKIGQDICIFFD